MKLHVLMDEGRYTSRKVINYMYSWRKLHVLMEEGNETTCTHTQEGNETTCTRGGR